MVEGLGTSWFLAFAVGVARGMEGVWVGTEVAAPPKPEHRKTVCISLFMNLGF